MYVLMVGKSKSRFGYKSGLSYISQFYFFTFYKHLSHMERDILKGSGNQKVSQQIRILKNLLYLDLTFWICPPLAIY